MMTPRFHHRRGSTLLIALWALLLLAAVVLGWARWVHQRIGLLHEENLALEARALAFSGLHLALHPSVTRENPALSTTTGYERGWEVTLAGEGRKLNLNYLLMGENPIRLDLLRSYLALRGLTLEQSDAFIDSVLDWTDGDNLRREHGAEEEPDYKPTNRTLTDLEELLHIRNTAPLLAYESWREDLTLLSRGPLDLREAPAEFIALIPGIGEPQAEAFVQYRRGSDGLDGTADDAAFGTPAEVASHLGLTLEQFQALSSLITLGDNTLQIRSIGRAGNVHRQIDVIARKMPNAEPTLLLMQEQ